MTSRPVMVLLALLVGSFTVSVSAEDPVEMEKEMAALREEVASAIAKVPRMMGPFDHITFEISGSVVTLQGFATGPSLKSDAEKRVRRIDWVTDVVNEIDFHQSEAGADQIREEVLEVLVDAVPDAFSERYPDLKIKVDPDFNVTIVGRLSPMNRTRLESALVRVDQIALVKSVENQVEYKPKR